MAPSNQKTCTSEYTIPLPREGDGFEQLRAPTDIYEWSKTLIYYDWLVFSEQSSAATRDMSLEMTIAFNASFGHTLLLRIGKWHDFEEVSNKMIVIEGCAVYERLMKRIVQIQNLEYLLQNGVIARYVDGFEIKQEATVEDRQCAICREELNMATSHKWTSESPVPTVCLPDLVKFLPLGMDDRMRFIGIFSELWKKLPDHSEDVNELYRRVEMEACCRQMGAAIKKYNHLDEADKILAESLQHVHPISERNQNIQDIMDIEYGVFEDEEKVELRAVRTGGQCSENRPSGNAEQAVETICGHRFGLVCLDKWLSQSTMCPMCRTDLQAKDDEDYGIEEYFDYAPIWMETVLRPRLERISINERDINH